MTVVVTGGSGLVGSHVIQALVARGETVRALARPTARAAVERLGAVYVPGSVTDEDAWRAAMTTPGGVRAVVHAAALVGQRATYEDFVAVNAGGTERAAAAARAAGARLVHLSSVAVYGRGPLPAGATVDEDFPFWPLAPVEYYARTKRLAEERLWEAHARGGLWAVALRPNVIYGEYDRQLTPRIVRFVRRGWVPQFGKGHNRLSCVYAGNVAAAVVAALDADAPGGRPYNVTNDGGLTQRELGAIAADVLGVRVRHVRIPRALAQAGVGVYQGVRRILRPRAYRGVGSAAVAFLTTENPYRSDRARAELGWRPVVAPADGLRRAVQWVIDAGSRAG